MTWMDRNILLHSEGKDEEDILSEFLDQRVFDSYNPEGTVPRDFDMMDENLLGFGKQQNQSFAEYELIRKEMASVKFGNPDMRQCPERLDADPSLLDFSKETMAQMPYELRVLDLPSQLRVETQIKFAFQFSPPPKQTLLHLPQDLILKHKLCLQEPVEQLSPTLQENMLFLDTYVMTSDLLKSCDICKRCIRREQKRALRLKNPGAERPLTPSIKAAQNLWADEEMVKKAIIFNCKEVVSFPAPSGLDSQQLATVDLFARIVCYCRHHKEADGFRLLVVARDAGGNVVAKSLSDPIMIMDRKKSSSAKEQQPLELRSGSVKLEEPLSPYLIDDSTSDALGNTDNTDLLRGAKRKKLSFDDLYNVQGNPMLNGLGLLPLSNSDTNTSVHNLLKPSFSFSPAFLNIGSIPRQRLQQLLVPQAQHPTIQKIIPAQGPIRGGIEVTLLGFNFRPGLNVKFGLKNSLATHCWSESTMVTYLPPAAAPGQVLVSFETLEHVIPANQLLVFTYTDDTDRQLIELALQIVGLKMNGKLEDAKNIAKRIVGSDDPALPGSQPEVNQASKDWYDNAHKAVEKLTKSDLATEDVLISFLLLVDLPNCPIIIPNWQLCNNEGHSLLHLATLKNYTQLIRFLVTHGCKIDNRDNQGLTPLFYAAMCGNRDLMALFLECKAQWNLRVSSDKMLKDYCDLNVLDVFERLELEENASDDSLSVSAEPIGKSPSADLLNLMFMMGYGKHVLKMVDTGLPAGKSRDYSSDFADSEFSDDALDEPGWGLEPQASPDCDAEPARPNLWQKMKHAVFADLDRELPLYDDLFPFGQKKPSLHHHDKEDVALDSSEDMVILYINHPRKTVQNDKMLLFFWIPILVGLLGLFLYVQITGYKVPLIEKCKDVGRDALGSIIVGNERIKRVFTKDLNI